MISSPDRHTRTPCRHVDVEEIASRLNSMADAARGTGILIPTLDDAANMLRKLSNIIDAKDGINSPPADDGAAIKGDR